MNEKDLSKQRFGRLVAIKKQSKSSNGNLWLCMCDCGKNTVVLSSNLLKGHTKSCGCLRADTIAKMNTTHGLRRSRIYGIWSDIKSRCSNPKRDMFYIYGGKGIRVCDEWLNFINFYKWAMLNGYQEWLAIDRIDNNGNYEPNNCKWSTFTEQVRNRNISIYIKFNGNSKTLKEWCDIYATKYHTAYGRYRKGWKFERIFYV